MTIQKNLYAWLNSQGYLVGNPWAGVTPRMSAAPKINAGRAFTKKQWQLIGEWVKALTETPANRRLGVVLALLYPTGMRREEPVTRKVCELLWEKFDADAGAWMLNVLGKRMKLRQVPIPDPIMAPLGYLGRRGLPEDPGHPDGRDAYLIGQVRAPRSTGHIGEVEVDPKAGISAATLYDQLKAFLAATAEELAAKSPNDADRLRMASVHWLRQTQGSHAVTAGVQVEDLKKNLGHASIATTSLYVTAEKRRRHAEVAKLLR